MKYFNNKIAWVTGASSGIGEALVLELNKLHCTTIISARRKEEIERVKLLCHHPDLVYVLTLDLEKPETFKDKVNEIISRYHQIDFIYLITEA